MDTKGYIKLLFCVIISIFISNNLFAQACCTGGTPLSGNLGIESYDANTLIVDFSNDYNLMDKLYAGSSKLNDSRRKRITKSSLLRISYALNNRLAITTIIPYVWQEQTVRSISGNIKQSANGIGDIVLLGQYSLIHNNKDQIILAAGPKFPSGSTSKRDDEFNILLPPDLQPGTGSWDGIGAISYSRSAIFRPTMSLFSLVSYRYSFEAERYDGQQKYRFGDEFVFNIGASDSFSLGKIIINPSFQYKFRHTQKDENNGSNFPNTGGSWMYLVPGFDIKINPYWSIRTNFEMPVRNDVEGTQLVTAFKGNIGINYKINIAKNKFLKIEN